MWLIELHIWIYVSHPGLEGASCGLPHNKDSREFNKSYSNLMVGNCQNNGKYLVSRCIIVFSDIIAFTHCFVYWITACLSAVFIAYSSNGIKNNLVISSTAHSHTAVGLMWRLVNLRRTYHYPHCHSATLLRGRAGTLFSCSFSDKNLPRLFIEFGCKLLPVVALLYLPTRLFNVLSMTYSSCHRVCQPPPLCCWY